MNIITMEELLDTAFGPVKGHVTYRNGIVIPFGGKVIIGGEANVGKSTLMLNLAYDLASGCPAFGIKEFDVPRPLRVLYVEAENHAIILKDRLQAIHKFRGCDLGGRLLVSTMGLPGRDDRLNRYLDKTCESLWVSMLGQHQPDIVMVDPLASFSKADENNATEINQMLEFVDMLIRTAPVSPHLGFMISHHLGKANQLSDPHELSMYRLRGSSRLVDWPDTIMLYQEIPRTKTPKAHDGKLYPPITKLTISKMRGADKPLPLLFRRADTFQLVPFDWELP